MSAKSRFRKWMKFRDEQIAFLMADIQERIFRDLLGKDKRPGFCSHPIPGADKGFQAGLKARFVVWPTESGKEKK